MKHYPEETINEAKSLYTQRKFGKLRIHRELLRRHPELQGLQQSTIGNWIAKGKWLDIRRDVAKKTNEAFTDQLAAENVKEMKIIDSSLSYVLTEMQNKKIRASVNDVVNLVKLRMLKRGEATENMKVDTEGFKIIINLSKKEKNARPSV